MNEPAGPVVFEDPLTGGRWDVVDEILLPNGSTFRERAGTFSPADRRAFVFLGTRNHQARVASVRATRGLPEPDGQRAQRDARARGRSTGGVAYYLFASADDPFDISTPTLERQFRQREDSPAR